MKRKIIAALCIAVLVITVGAISYTTVANFTTIGVARNVITTGGFDFVINETTASGEKFPIDGVEILPGDTVSKIVTGENKSNHPMYFRIKLTKDVSDKELSVGDRLTMDIDTEYWTYKDGYYYYNEAIGAHEETKPLFTKVYIDGPGVDNDYLGKAFTLKVSGQAVQSENNGETVFDAAGWPDAE